MSGATTLEFPQNVVFPPWDLVTEIAHKLNHDSWLLVGGLMVQAHALLNQETVRATTDVDLIIDVFSDTKNIDVVTRGIQDLGFEMKIPGLRFAPFHRMIRGEDVVDVLVADHLPSRKQKAARLGALNLMDAVGGAQALDRRMQVWIETETGDAVFSIPDVLGALIMKAAAACSDSRSPRRHLDDAALLASLITNPENEKERLHGSDMKRLRGLADTLKDSRHPSWLLLSSERRSLGREVLEYLAR